MTLTALRGRIYLFGGSGTHSKCFHDLQVLDRNEMAWLDVTPHEPSYQSYHRNFRPSATSLAQDDPPTLVFGSSDDDSEINPQAETGREGDHRAGAFTSSRADWRSRELAAQPRTGALHASPNPNDEASVTRVLLQGRGPGRRAGHTATAVNRKIYVFGGSCGADYLNDFFVLDTDPPPRAKVTEPTTLNLIERRVGHFFNDEEFSDVTFIVQGRRVYGHRMVLAIVSDIFRAMFTSGFRESSSSEIEITDCSYDAFLAVMEYIYTGKIPSVCLFTIPNALDLGIKSESDVANKVVDILELADRFFLDHLKQICEEHLQSFVKVDTVEFLLQIAQKTNSMQLLAVCEHLMRNRGDNIRY
jgi:leucine-zipper-like transcriptional regulator 1